MRSRALEAADAHVALREAARVEMAIADLGFLAFRAPNYRTGPVGRARELGARSVEEVLQETVMREQKLEAFSRVDLERPLGANGAWRPAG